MPSEFPQSWWTEQLIMLPGLGVALLLSMLIGLERQFRGKEAGVRTHALVGIGSALFMLVSKYGFGDLLQQSGISLDPSRVAAQIVSGIGFLGAGIIVFRSDAVRGLTTAASIWLTAAVGTAAGAHLYLLAAAVTLGHFVVVLVGPRLSRLRPRALRSELWVEYRDGQGLLRDVLTVITDHQWRISQVRTAGHQTEPGYVAVSLATEGRKDSAVVVDAVSRIPGVRTVEWRDSGAEQSDEGD